jgi:hypothetical protein
MAGLIGQAGGGRPDAEAALAQAQQAWQESMLREVSSLREALRGIAPAVLADRSGASFDAGALSLRYWGRLIRIEWPSLTAEEAETGKSASTFDLAMLLYYLNTADGTPLADRWVGYRDLPGAVFYHQAFQGYSGDRLARHFGGQPAMLSQAAPQVGGWRLPDLSPHAFAFAPLPRVRLAAVLWEGDDEIAARAAILFDAAAGHYMPTDGLALLGSGLAGRLIRAAPASPA